MGDPIDVRESRRLNELRKRNTPATVPRLVVAMKQVTDCAVNRVVDKQKEKADGKTV